MDLDDGVDQVQAAFCGFLPRTWHLRPVSATVFVPSIIARIWLTSVKTISRAVFDKSESSLRAPVRRTSVRQWITIRPAAEDEQC
ncbi:hypothetical protein [Mesorhizobium sp. M0578]|uniref:hypothetical protein n=1 Tax=unclassified Mesorhizobium TaxID=325217 RepID=UPI003338CD0F